MTLESRQKIAIIGTGISGMGAANLLNPSHDITVYEKNNYIGGHSRTVDVHIKDGVIPVDTGFIVFNYRNYPLLTALFSHLNVSVAKSNMSFGASINSHWLEYGTQSIGSIFAQKKNLLRPAFWRMICDVMRFNKRSLDYMEKDPSITLGQCLDELGMGSWFKHYYLLAMGGAIWSMPLSSMLDFPARTLIRFFHNHGLLSISDQPQWYTVSGGSREYVEKLTEPFKQKIRLGCGVKQVIRNQDKITVIDSNGAQEIYDQVVFSCHSDQALAVMINATEEEKKILGSFRYQTNRMVLHSDTSFMPKHKAAWASWVYLSEQQKDESQTVSLSYWMNSLQPLATDIPIIVTLNPVRQPEKALVYDEYWFEHPVFDKPAISSQPLINSIQGKNRFWFCGAYQRYGFHEDGLASAVHMANLMGAKPTWK